ncbi:MAG TPA: photosystem reaction center subunit H, partial [Leptolyngbya sp.]|nr:photosystem reaction center subunit H [Leptolyngbya sp.]
ETGELLGKVRGFRFNIDTGKLDTLVIASIGLPLIPDQVVSTYELPITEIVSSGPDRLIVIEGSEERMSQLSVGVLERLGIGKPPWEREQDQYLSPARPENQLPSGVRTPLETPQPQVRQPIEQTWDDDEWEPEPIPLRREEEAPRQQYREAEIYPPPTAYEEDEEDNWGGLAARNDDEYADEIYDDNYVDVEDEAIVVDFEEIKPELPGTPESFEPGNLDEDPWAETQEEGVPLQPLQIPDKPKQKQPEYEEEGY